MNKYDWIALAVAAVGFLSMGVGCWIRHHDRVICRWINELEE